MGITKEDLSQFIASEESKSILAEVGLLTMDDHTKKLGEEVKGLADSKTKILSEKKSLEEKFKSLQPKTEALERLSRILESHEIVVDKDGVYDFNGLEDLIVKGKNGGAGGTSDEIQKELAEYKRKHRDLDLDYKSKISVLEKTGTELKTANEFIEKLLIEDSIRKELARHDDIPKELHDSLILVLRQRSGAIVETDAENPTDRRAVTKEGDTIARFIELWMESPEAKVIRRAPQNTGGGSNHSGQGQQKGKEMLRSEWEALSPDQQRTFIKSGGRLRD